MDRVRRNPQALQNHHARHYRLVGLQQELAEYLTHRDLLGRNARFLTSANSLSLGVVGVRSLSAAEWHHIRESALKHGFEPSMTNLFRDLLVFITRKLPIEQRVMEMREWLDFNGR